MKELKSTQENGVSKETALQIGNAVIKFNRIARIFSVIILTYIPLTIVFWKYVEPYHKVAIVLIMALLSLVWFFNKRKSNQLRLHYDLQSWLLDCIECEYKFNHFVNKNNIKAENPD